MTTEDRDPSEGIKTRVTDKRGRRGDDTVFPLPLTPQQEQELIAKQIKEQEATPYSGGGIKAPQVPPAAPEETQTPPESKGTYLTAFGIAVAPDGSVSVVDLNNWKIEEYTILQPPTPPLMKRAAHDLVDEILAGQTANAQMQLQMQMAAQMQAQQQSAAIAAQVNGHPMAMPPRPRHGR